MYWRDPENIIRSKISYLHKGRRYRGYSDIPDTGISAFTGRAILRQHRKIRLRYPEMRMCMVRLHHQAHAHWK